MPRSQRPPRLPKQPRYVDPKCGVPGTIIDGSEVLFITLANPQYNVHVLKIETKKDPSPSLGTRQ